MMVGLPGSGKSTTAEKLSKELEVRIHASDQIRKELYGDESIAGDNQKVFSILHNRIRDDLRNGKSVIYDATNINSKKRRNFLKEIDGIDCEKICVIVAKEYAGCLNQNAQRERSIPEEAIKRMYLNWKTPYWFEGWDDIQIIYNDLTFLKDPYLFPLTVYQFNQDSPHHTKTLGIHCIETSEHVKKCGLMRRAASIHDCGKPFTKSYLNTKGEQTSQAHYYNHQNVGAYDALFYDPGENSQIDVSILVNLHMEPFFWKSDKENGSRRMDKARSLWGDSLFDKVMVLHNADRQAH